MENRPRGRRRCRICLGAELDAEGRVSPDAIPEFGYAYTTGGERFLPHRYDLPYELQRIGPDRSHRSQLPVLVTERRLDLCPILKAPASPGLFADHRLMRALQGDHIVRAFFATCGNSGIEPDKGNGTGSASASPISTTRSMEDAWGGSSLVEHHFGDRKSSKSPIPLPSPSGIASSCSSGCF